MSITGAPGTATLAGALAPAPDGDYVPRGNQVFPGIITASGGVSGAFSTIVNQQITPILSWRAKYNPNSVDLMVQRNYTRAGLNLGADYRLRDNLLVGLATGYSYTTSGLSGSGGSVIANAVPVNAYMAYFPGKLYVYGSLRYTLNLYNLNRGLNFSGISRTASSSTTGIQLNFYGETGYDLRLSRGILTPSATLTYSGLWVGSFTESGAGSLNLNVDSQSANSVQTGIGARVTVPVKVRSMQVVPQGYAFYPHEFSNGSRDLNGSLDQGSSSLRWQTTAAGRN